LKQKACTHVSLPYQCLQNRKPKASNIFLLFTRVARMINYRLFDALGDAVMARRESSEKKHPSCCATRFRYYVAAAIIMKYRWNVRRRVREGRISWCP